MVCEIIFVLIMILDDFNDLKIIDICETSLLKQVVKVPTCKYAIIDLIMTNVDDTLYKEITEARTKW